MDILFPFGKRGRIFIGHPAGINRIHKDPVFRQIARRGVGQHIERSLGHIGMRMTVGLDVTMELPFHRRDIHDMFFAGVVPLHHRRQFIT